MPVWCWRAEDSETPAVSAKMPLIARGIVSAVDGEVDPLGRSASGPADFSTAACTEHDAGSSCISAEISESGCSPALDTTVVDVLSRVRGRVWSRSKSAEGSRDVQLAIEHAPTDAVRADLASELCGHVWKAMRCPHASHVLQKLILTMRPKESKFILDEIMSRPDSIIWASQHKLACRTIQALFEHCAPEETVRLGEFILGSFQEMLHHPFGNYVLQRMIEHGTCGLREQLVMKLEAHTQLLGNNAWACAVLCKALTCCRADNEIQLSLARAILRDSDLLTAMACTKHGSVAVKLILDVLVGSEFEEALEQLRNNMESLRCSQHGKKLLAKIRLNEHPIPANP
jgi:hypothetical protein